MAPKKKYPILKQCIVCLNDFEVISPNHNHNKTCTRTCANKLISSKRGLLYECDLDQLLQDYNNGLSYGELKTKHFLSNVALYNRLKILKQSGKLIKRPQLPYVHSKTEIDMDRLAKAYNECTKQELSKLFDCGVGIINDRLSILFKNGIIKKKIKKFDVNVNELRSSYVFFEGCIFDIANKFKVSQSTITRYLKIFHKEGLLPEYGTFKSVGKQKLKDSWKPHWI